MHALIHSLQDFLARCDDAHRATALLALASLEGFGTSALSRLLACAVHHDDLCDTGPSISLDRHQRDTLTAFLQNPERSAEWVSASATQQWLQERDGVAFTLFDAEYPKLLVEIPDPPLVLLARGNIELLHSPSLAVVGSRRPARSGVAATQRLVASMARYELTIVSGMALGIDAVAHRAALDAGLPTVAVWATGPDVIYPARHRALASDILDQGCIVTEMPLGTRARPGYFPRRNRIVSGLSRGVLVVEAAVASGSLLTARLATEQNREVFAVPGPVESPLSRGCHQLIREGATLVETAADIAAEFGLRATHEVAGNERAHRCLPASLSPAAVDVWYALDYAACDREALALRLPGLAAAQLAAALVELELEALVLVDAGSYQRAGCPA